jgi:hypothetical protein
VFDGVVEEEEEEEEIHGTLNLGKSSIIKVEVGCSDNCVELTER